MNRVKAANSAVELVRSLQDMRRQEADYIVSKKFGYVADVDKKAAGIRAKAKELKKRLNKINSQKMDTFIKRVDDYDAAFKQYGQLEEQKNRILIQMEGKAKEALADIGGIRSDLANQLKTAMAESDLLVQQRLSVFEKATQIIQ